LYRPETWVTFLLFLLNREEMAWKEATVIEKRAEFVLLTGREGSNMSHPLVKLAQQIDGSAITQAARSTRCSTKARPECAVF
jgi:hypothetical protein